MNQIVVCGGTAVKEECREQIIELVQVRKTKMRDKSHKPINNDHTLHEYQ